MYSIFQNCSIIEFKNAFTQVDIQKEKKIFVEVPRNVRSNWGWYIFLKLKKNLYGEAKSTHIWDENMRYDLSDISFVAIKVDLCLFMYKTVIYVEYVDFIYIWNVYNLILIKYWNISRKLGSFIIGNNQRENHCLIS